MKPIDDALRSELIFLPDDGTVTRVADGLRILTPSNPSYWWGNSLRMDRAPVAGDVDRWKRLFAEHIHAVQPASTHWAFAWDGEERGDIDRFVAEGFSSFETIALAADRGDLVTAPHPEAAARVVAIRTDDDWRSVLALEVETRDRDVHPEAAYATFIARRIAGWRRLQELGQGCWFGIPGGEGSRIVSSLGIFAERERGADGRRIGRFQHVATLAPHRGQGLAGTLLAHASRFAFDRLDVDTLLIVADANDAARRVYESCGYRTRSRHRALERGSYAPTAASSTGRDEPTR